MPARERTYRTEAIVLRRKDFGEADRVLTLLTPDRGKLRVAAKGIRKPASRKAGHLELFTRVRLLLARGRDLDIITQAETAEAYRPLREDLLRGAYAAYAVELLDRFTPDEQENPELYALLAAGLGWLSESADLALTARYYELHLLSLAGFQPEFFQCTVCGAELTAQDQFFSLDGGGAVCADCGAARLDLLALTLPALKLLRHLQRSTYAQIAALHVRPATQNEVETLLRRYITHHLERQLKSVEFLRLIQKA